MSGVPAKANVDEPGVPEMETARLALRRLSHGDAGFLLRLLNDPAFLRFIGDKGVRCPEDARRYLDDGPLSSYRDHGFGLYLVTRNTDGASIGICGLLKRESLRDVDIGFAFLPDFRSKGYAVEAAGAVLAHGKALGIERIVAVTTAENHASIRVLEKLGMHFSELVRLAPDEPEHQLFAPR